MTRSGGPTAANDADRLPWLEPFRDTAIASARPVLRAKKSENGQRGGLILISSVALVAALASGYWLGQQRNGSAGTAETGSKPTSNLIEIAEVRPEVAPPPIAEKPATSDVTTSNLASPAVTKGKGKAKAPRSRVPHETSRSAKLKRRSIESDRFASVLGKQGEVRAWPKMPSPGPAGQVIQLGAFSSPSRAETAYRARTGRYPLLGTLPKVVVPIVTQPRGEILYVLRLGTQSREQSTIVCRNLRNSGDHCLVIG